VDLLASLYDPEAKGERIKMPDGSTVERLPGFRKWMWDGEFCGSIGFRLGAWYGRTAATLPWAHRLCRGAVETRLGLCHQAVRALLPEAQALVLRYIEITTDLDNIASQRVVLAVGGKLVERSAEPAQYGGIEALRFRLDL
jgi:RimJ/RimL family protein N-acetyltransferase